MGRGRGALTQEFGPTDFSRKSAPSGTPTRSTYGFPEPGHTGLDVGIVAGTTLYAPSDAVVVCAGTGNGNGEDGCAGFASSTGGHTSGRLQLRLPSGDMLIYGHVARQCGGAGRACAAGQLGRLLREQNGDHVHLEYRVPDPDTAPAGASSIPG